LVIKQYNILSGSGLKKEKMSKNHNLVYYHISLFNQYKCILIFQVYHSPGINAGENTEETDGITSKVKSLKKEWM
jgi:hypothetical protein